MPGSSTLISKALKELLIALLAIALFLLVTGVGGWASLQVTKRQFEAEAQNIAAVLRSGISVADGVVTSLVASDFTNANRLQLDAHFSDVLGNFEYVSALGRFERFSADELGDFESRMKESGSTAQRPWYLTKSGDVTEALESYTREYYLPLTDFKSRYSDDNPEHADLSGLDLGILRSVRTAASAGRVGRTAITSLPAHWNRPGELLLLRASASETTRGYILELDLDEMASSGGVEIDKFNIHFSMFSEQGEFASDGEGSTLYSNAATAGTELQLKTLFKDNTSLSSFSMGHQTLLFKISRPAGLPDRLAAFLCLIGAIAALIFLTGVQLVAKKRSALKLQRVESEKLYSARYRAAVTLASIDDAVITTDVDDNVLYANEAAEKLLGSRESDIKGSNVDSVVQYTEEAGNLVLFAADNEQRYINKKQSPLKDLNGDHCGHVLVLRDVSVEHALTQELQYKVSHDLLTGLSNRLSFEEKLQELITLPDQHEDDGLEKNHALCFIDLDRFKEVNDTCGHDAGDELLIRVAETFRTSVRDYDLVARLGGDEFGIVLHNCSESSAQQVTQRIQERFQSFFFEYDEHVFPVRCSIGFVCFVPGEVSFDAVIKSADAACFDAKRLGRNSVCQRSVGDSQKQEDQGSMWLPRLQSALDTDGFDLLVQPVASLLDGNISMHEVLLRLNEDGVLTSPNAFMKSAVRYELAERIDRWVIHNTFTKFAALKSQYATDKFAINLSSQSIKSADFLEYLKEQILFFGIDPAMLCFDIKESDLLSKPAESEEFCRSLRAFGSEVALDDFGAGLTSFELLKSVPVTALKIDGSLIAKLGDALPDVNVRNADHAMVQSIHSFSSSMGLATIAEQVESHQGLEVLRLLGVEFAQGSAVVVEMPFESLLNDSTGLNSKAA